MKNYILRFKKILLSLILIHLDYTISLANNNINWNTSAGSFESERFFVGTQITKNNIKNLEKLWIFNSGSTDKFNTVQASPIFVKDQLILVTLSADLISVSPVTGKLNWKKKLISPLGRRGITFYESKNNNTGIYVASGNKVFQIDLNGNIVNEYLSGKSLLQPIIHKDKLYVATLNDGVKAFDLNTKKKIWHTSLNKNNVNPRIWSGFSFDKETKTLFVVTSNPGGVIGKNRSGDDYSVSLIAFSAETGNIKWNYKHIINDVWDFDLISNPLIIRDLNIKENDYLIDVVVALTKTGDVIMLDLLNGLPVFKNSYKEINVEKSDLKNVSLSPKQKLYLLPEKFSSIIVDKKNDFTHLDADNLKYIKNKLRNSKTGFFVPPSLNYDVVTYGLHGGAEWPGGSIFRDGTSANLIIPSNNNPWIIRVSYQDKKYLKIIKFLENKNVNKIKDLILSTKNLFKKEKKFNEQNNIETPLSNQNIDSNFVDTSFKNREKPNLFKPPSSNKYKVANFLYEYMPGSYKNSIYQKNCSSCHGNARQGRLDTEDKGDNYYPSLVGITKTKKFNSIDTYSKFKKVHLINNIELNIDEIDFNKIIKSFKEHDEKLFEKGLVQEKGSWQILLDKNGLPATKPPWGKITNINLLNGKKIWEVPFGTRKLSNGKLIKGDINFGGVMSTKNKIIFATGTTDPYAYAYNLENGEIIWKNELPYSGSAQPMGFNYKGCDIIVFTSTGGRFVGYTLNGDATIAYKLKTCNFN